MFNKMENVEKKNFFLNKEHMFKTVCVRSNFAFDSFHYDLCLGLCKYCLRIINIFR